MALDHALRDRADTDGTAILRLYQWSEDTISFGANEAANRHWDRSRIEAASIPTVRRPTGGRAVWHAATDLTYAVTAPLAALGGLQPAYVMIHRALAAALSRLGVAARLAPAPPRLPGLRRGACFDVAVGGEVMIGSTKVIGSAQVVTRGALLQHGELARGDRLAPLARFGKGVGVAAIESAWPVLPAAAVIADAIEAEWGSAGATAAPGELTAWADAASVQHMERYCDPLWTWRR
jgi:lipoyl(octanoyl) transferase